MYSLLLLSRLLENLIFPQNNEIFGKSQNQVSVRYNRETINWLTRAYSAYKANETWFLVSHHARTFGFYQHVWNGQIEKKKSLFHIKKFSFFYHFMAILAICVVWSGLLVAYPQNSQIVTLGKVHGLISSVERALGLNPGWEVDFACRNYIVYLFYFIYWFL